MRGGRQKCGVRVRRVWDEGVRRGAGDIVRGAGRGAGHGWVRPRQAARRRKLGEEVGSHHLGE